MNYLDFAENFTDSALFARGCRFCNNLPGGPFNVSNDEL